MRWSKGLVETQGSIGGVRMEQGLLGLLLAHLSRGGMEEELLSKRLLI